jgi:phosphoribosylamine--glycine ligase
MASAHYEAACSIIERVIARLAEQGRHFSGVMNSGFFATADGVKVIEFNARFGDPECMNIMSLFEGNWTEVMQSISAGSLSAEQVPLRSEASVVLYLVSPDYALRPGSPIEFTLPESAIAREGCEVLFSSAVRTGEHGYRTVGTSRALALATTAPTLEQARARVAGCAGSIHGLEWRRDVGDMRYLEGLSKLVGPSRSGGEGPLLTNAL